MGIDLFPSGPNPNDAGDADSGPNELMNFPDISTIVNIPSTSDWIVSGNLDHSSPAGCRIELFLADLSGGGYGQGQGKLFLGACLTDASGNFTDTVTGITSSDKLVATATDLNGNTSEFSLTGPLSVETTLENDFNVDVYPNPAKTNFNIEFRLVKSCYVKIKIIDNVGKFQTTILSEYLNEGKQIFSFSSEKTGLKPGMYWLKFSVNRKTCLRRLIIQ